MRKKRNHITTSFFLFLKGTGTTNKRRIIPRKEVFVRVAKIAPRACSSGSLPLSSWLSLSDCSVFPYREQLLKSETTSTRFGSFSTSQTSTYNHCNENTRHCLSIRLVAVCQCFGSSRFLAFLGWQLEEDSWFIIHKIIASICFCYCYP